MAEPQPAAIREGAADGHAPTATADDLKAAAVLSSLDTQDDTVTSKKEVDGKALDQAMKNLSIDNAKGEAKKNVKVDPAAVNLLIRELEVNKQRAVDLLKRYGGDVVEAMGAFVSGKA